MDIIAIQEVMDPAAVDHLEQLLERQTGELWQSMTSHLIGRGSYREAYSFLYRDASVEYVDGAVVFLDHRDTFSREPYSARFRSRHSGTEFVLANIHVLYGNSVSDRLPEIHALADYWDWLEEVYGDTPGCWPATAIWPRSIVAGARCAIAAWTRWPMMAPPP